MGNWATLLPFTPVGVEEITGEPYMVQFIKLVSKPSCRITLPCTFVIVPMDAAIVSSMRANIVLSLLFLFIVFPLMTVNTLNHSLLYKCFKPSVK